jgi:hypothetical protein
MRLLSQHVYSLQITNGNLKLPPTHKQLPYYYSRVVCGEGPRSRCYGRTTALRFVMKMKRKMIRFFTGGMKLTGENRITCGKTCPSATLSTTNPTWTDRDRTRLLR